MILDWEHITKMYHLIPSTVPPRPERRYDRVTDVLNATRDPERAKSLAEWRARVGEDVAAHIGRESVTAGLELHELNAKYLRGTKLTRRYGLLGAAHHVNMREYLHRIYEVREIEADLYSDALGIAGTADCIADYGTDLAVIEYKTNRSPPTPAKVAEYHLQTAAYAIMYEELTGIRPSNSVVLISTEVGTSHAFVEALGPHRTKFLSRLHQYRSGSGTGNTSS